MHLDDALRNREAQTGAALLPGAAVVDLLELLEDARLVLGRDAGAGIAYSDLETAVDRVARRFRPTP